MKDNKLLKNMGIVLAIFPCSAYLYKNTYFSGENSSSSNQLNSTVTLQTKIKTKIRIRIRVFIWQQRWWVFKYSDNKTDERQKYERKKGRDSDSIISSDNSSYKYSNNVSNSSFQRKIEITQIEVIDHQIIAQK